MARLTPPMERADVLIVGAGASGAVVAGYLAERGFRVVCLEQGGWVNASDYPGDKPEWELAAAKQWHHDPNVRGLPADYPCDVSQADVAPLDVQRRRAAARSTTVVTGSGCSHRTFACGRWTASPMTGR